MAVAVREALLSGSNSVANTATIGAASAIGDVVYVIHGDDFYTAAAMTAPTMTGPTFTQQGATVDMGSNQCHCKVWSTTLTAAGSQVITCHSTNVDQERYMATYVLTGASPTIDAMGPGGSTTSQTTLSIPSITVLASGCLLIGAWQTIPNSVGTIASPTSPLVQRGTTFTIASLSEAAIFDALAVATGATGAKQVTAAPGSAWAGVLFTVPPSGAAVPPKSVPIIHPAARTRVAMF